jgi:tetratricopeptide (TPR) repeat protein
MGKPWRSTSCGPAFVETTEQCVSLLIFKFVVLMATNPAKAAEAQAEMKEGEKHLATTVFKWKADWVSAEPCFARAARSFKLAGLADSAVSAWRRAADCSVKAGNLKQAAATLETASREMAVARDSVGKSTACALMGECAALLIEAGEPVRAADLKLRAAKLAEGFDKEAAARLVDEVISIFEGDSDKDVYAVEPLKKALVMQLQIGKHASAMRSFDKIFSIWQRLDQKHNLYKVVLSKVVLLLAAADPVAAQGEFDRNLDLAGFAPTEEAAAAEDLVGAYLEQDSEALKKVLARNCFNYLEHGVNAVARKLPEGLEAGGASVGGARADELASAAVKARPQLAPGEFRALGSNTVGAAQQQAEPEDNEDEMRARKKADKEYDLRASLFARPGGAAASAASSAPAAAGGGSKQQQEEEEDAFGGADELESAFASMAGVDGGGDGGASAGASAGATAAAAGGGDGGAAAAATAAPAPAKKEGEGEDMSWLM